MSPSVRARPALLLLHSSGSSARQWQPLVELLQPRFRAIPVELHGHGTRPPWEGRDAPFTLADDASLVMPILERLGEAHLVGHSYGAAVALKVATLGASRVLSVTAYEPPLFRALFDDAKSRVERAEIAAAVEWMRMRLAQGDGLHAAKRFIEYWSGADAWEYLPPSRQSAIAARMPTVLRHFDALFGELYLPARLAGFRAPLLFLTGRETVGSTWRIGQLLRDALPDADHETLAGMGHMGPVTHAAEVNARIAAFLQSCRGMLSRRTHAPLAARIG
jgi:pimeloyl-ACP methyl ester carboxylesterase